MNTSSDRVYSLHSTIRIKEDEESGSGGQESSLRHQQLAQRMYETMNVEVPFGIAQIFRRDPKIDSIFRDKLVTNAHALNLMYFPHAQLE